MWRLGRPRSGISIHALREEGDLADYLIAKIRDEFLSTPSARRATEFIDFILEALSNFYPRPPRGGRHLLSAFGRDPVSISIHALREEGDAIFAQYAKASSLFLSTPSARRAT